MPPFQSYTIIQIKTHSDTPYRHTHSLSLTHTHTLTHTLRHIPEHIIIHTPGQPLKLAPGTHKDTPMAMGTPTHSPKTASKRLKLFGIRNQRLTISDTQRPPKARKSHSDTS